MSEEELFEYCKQASDEITRLQNKIDKAIKYINIETEGRDENPIEGSWLYNLYAVRDILGDDNNE